MSKNSVKEWIIFQLVNGIGSFLRSLTLKQALAFGRGVGCVFAFVRPKHRRIVYNNLKQAFGRSAVLPEISPAGEISAGTVIDYAGRQELLRTFYARMGQNLVEILRIPLILEKKEPSRVDVRGYDHVYKALEKGKGVIFLSMHSGNWELSNLIGSTYDPPYNLVANPLKKTSKLEELLNGYRSAAGAKIIFPGLGSREIIRRLKKNEIVTLVADQGGREGMLTEFFGKRASMSTGAVRLALKYGAAIMMVDIYRTSPSQHRLDVEPYALVNSGDAEEDVRTNVRLLTEHFERKICAHPAEYMWLYKVWKFTDDRVVLVLSDEKIGHLRQSQKLSKVVADVLTEKGKRVRVVTVPVEFRSRQHAKRLAVCGGLFRWSWKAGQMGWLKHYLTDRSFEDLMAIKADVVISCGSSLAAVNHAMAMDNQCRSIVILKPGLIPMKAFDAVILPQHDAGLVGGRANVIVTQAAPNLISARYLDEQGSELLKRFSHLKNRIRKTIGVLVGGDTKGVVMTERHMRLVLQQIKTVAESLDADLLITTSRRTPVAVNRLIAGQFRKDSRCPFLVTQHHEAVPEALGGILALSDIVVVSGESISMVSEAVSSGKPTVVFPAAQWWDASSKYARFVESLSRKGYLVSTDQNNLSRSIYDVAKQKIQTRPIEDDAVLRDALMNIL